jgi:hypothetical protein
MPIKPIETVYKGYRFRSRIEARWAVVFKTLAQPWEYEKEGYDLGDAGWYLPDFWLPNTYDRIGHRGIWVEIKGQQPSDIESQRCEALALGTKHSVMMFVGPPRTYYEGTDSDGHYQWTYDAESGDIWWDNYMRLHYCSDCFVAKVEFDNDYFTCPQCKKETCIPHHPLIDASVKIARSTRFEHGDRER